MGLKGFASSGERLSSDASRAPKEHTGHIDPYEPGRALVPVQSPDLRDCPGRYPAAPFLAHLIASQQREPQTRDRRRAEPSVAIDAYETWLAGEAPVNGRRLYRVM
jgi:hypothetical protein